jgi:hypothetical protein
MEQSYRAGGDVQGCGTKPDHKMNPLRDSVAIKTNFELGKNRMGEQIRRRCRRGVKGKNGSKVQRLPFAPIFRHKTFRLELELGENPVFLGLLV